MTRMLNRQHWLRLVSFPNCVSSQLRFMTGVLACISLVSVCAPKTRDKIYSCQEENRIISDEELKERIINYAYMERRQSWPDFETFLKYGVVTKPFSERSPYKNYRNSEDGSYALIVYTPSLGAPYAQVREISYIVDKCGHVTDRQSLGISSGVDLFSDDQLEHLFNEETYP